MMWRMPSAHLQWSKTCWCLKEIFRTILCLEGVLFYFSFCTASIWNKSPWVCYILKTQLKTFIGSGPPDHITLVAQYTLTFSNQSKGMRVGVGGVAEIKRVVSGVVCGVTTPDREKIWVTKQTSLLTIILNEPIYVWPPIKRWPSLRLQKKNRTIDNLLIEIQWL